MSNDQEFAAYVSPSKHVIHTSRAVIEGVDMRWHLVNIAGLKPYSGHMCYVLSKKSEVPNGAYVLKSYGGSSIHYVIVDEH